MKLSVALRLGRVSNLPTVTTNVLAAVALADLPASTTHVVLLCVAMSLCYVGGMWLNDAYDREIDRRERPERPIPSGEADAAAVFAWGYAMLVAGIGLVGALAIAYRGGGFAVLSAIALAVLIVVYDMHHKGNPWSPLLMGLCRAAVYTTASLSVAGDVSTPVVIGAAALVAYLIGLTYVAKQENLRELGNLWPLAFLAAALIAAWPSGSRLAIVLHLMLAAGIVRALILLARRQIKDAVTGLIAGIALLDAVWIANHGDQVGAIAALCAYVLTTTLQRVVPGT